MPAGLIEVSVEATQVGPQGDSGLTREEAEAYLAWLDVSQVVDRIDAKRLAAEASRSAPTPVTPEMMVERYFVKHAKVQMNAGSNYGFGGAGRMRMNVATSRKLVELALTNMANALRTAS